MCLRYLTFFNKESNVSCQYIFTLSLELIKHILHKKANLERLAHLRLLVYLPKQIN
jgi:hypothetical protein